MKEFATKAALGLLGKCDRDHADPAELEGYYPPNADEKVYCSTDEREDFERDMEIALTADVLTDQRDYDDLVRYLVENYDLKEI